MVRVGRFAFAYSAVLAELLLSLIAVTSVADADQTGSAHVPEISLSGIWLEPKSSWAILRLKDGKEDLFEQGATIAGVGKLLKVKKRCVTIAEGTPSIERELCLSEGSGSAAKPPTAGPRNDLVDKALAKDLETSSVSWFGSDGRVEKVIQPSGEISGLSVESLSPESFLARVGLGPKDIITAVNGTETKELSDLSLAMQNMSGRMIEIEFMRGAVSQAVALRLTDEVIAAIASKHPR